MKGTAMPVRSPALIHALAVVDEDAFVRTPDGNLVTQSSSREVIADLIECLDVRPGMTVLEIGTGSGYSTALLAELVGGDGSVLSIDVVAELVARASTLLPAQGYPNTRVVRADGAQGAPEHGPFDRIIAWTTAPHLPSAWVTQLAADGFVVAPLAAAPISKSGIGARVELTDHGVPRVTRLFCAGFVEMHGQELDQWLVPPTESTSCATTTSSAPGGCPPNGCAAPGTTLTAGRSSTPWSPTTAAPPAPWHPASQPRASGPGCWPPARTG
jgi:protein-L-isoaspartate(D-aspartate) O-methyltransferase